MRMSCLAATVAIAISGLLGCGANDAPAKTTTTPPPAPPFELDGAWIYLGPSDPPHILTVTDTSMNYDAVAGDWSSDWDIKHYDNALHQFQIVFKSGTGTYLPMGQNLSGTYDLNGTVLTIQLAQGLATYPPLQDAGTCTSATDGTPVPNCSLLIKQN
jgi:hypothetical protein